MRHKPSLPLALAVFVGYVVIASALWAALDVDYDAISDSAANVREAVVIPIGVGAVYLAITTTLLGWWRPALFESARVGPMWMAIALPTLVGIGVLLNLAGSEWDQLETGFLWWLLVGTAFVGFSEELLTRGLIIVGARATLSENYVWLVSGALFGVLHSINALFGQGAGDTVSQMVFAFLIGTVFYVIRRTTGTIIVTMVLHAGWDYSTFTLENTGASGSGGLGLYLALMIAFVAVVMMSARPDDWAPTSPSLRP